MVRSHKYEFHVSRQARDLYKFDQILFALSGNVIIANFKSARDFAQRMNDKRDLIRFPERAVRASDINAMGLIDEVLHLLVESYVEENNKEAIDEALNWLNDELGSDLVDQLLFSFTDQFPTVHIYRGEKPLEEYLAGETAGTPNRHIALVELIMLWSANSNPAFSPYLELFDDEKLEKQTLYMKVFPSLREYFETQPKFDGLNLIEALLAPAKEDPYSLSGQLNYLLKRWGKYLGSKFLYRVLGGLDFIKEESKIVIGTGGGGDISVFEFTGLESEPERFSPDRDWMPSLVLIAKNAYVWLDQLSKQHGRDISRLDQVPEEELDRLAQLGFTGLWLIGLWERSSASKKIKQLCGNPDAVASAYSLHDYQIAHDLGGDDAYDNLRDRAWRRGIRLAADMVPNHVGVYSKWVIEHPDWFVYLDYSPYPNYSFNGPDLSEDDRVGIFIEDHYYNRSDAAVVFKRVDRWTGREQYIYHGNDGTSMPWNDTAQLNYLLPEVREAVIQTILHVARKFPVIRFDAAMTLAKKHFQRLWFPEPGSGGDIPTRAEFGLTRDEFDSAIPQEFWREVVDRVAQEAPDTLLLAEAFWLMEGYFVRTLGMHRVYNSAFMNMLRDEKNAEYRLVLKNTLEFDTEILKRYVNFMNNPDERTAVDQFGKGDKYMGIATMLATLPGLPMFGHGQVEGYTEKYGMEYRRAYWDEKPDTYLVDRHQKEISPLLHKRYIFAEARDFLLYDFYTPDGNVNEDVFGYSNKSGDERGLVVYHNRFADTRGWLRISAAFSVKIPDSDEKFLQQKNIGDGLDLVNDQGWYTIYKDHRSGLEYIRNNREIYENGLFFELGAYDYHVLLDFRQIQDNEWHQYGHLTGYLAGRGVPSINEALQELFLQSVHLPFKDLVNAGQFKWLIQHQKASDSSAIQEELEIVLDEVEQKAARLLHEIKDFTDAPGDADSIADDMRKKLEVILSIPAMDQVYDFSSLPKSKVLIDFIKSKFENNDLEVWGTLLSWWATHELGKIKVQGLGEVEANAADIHVAALQSRTWMDEWLLNKLVIGALRDLGMGETTAWQTVGLSNLLISYQNWNKAEVSDSKLAYLALTDWLKDWQVQRYIRTNRHQGVLWFNKELFESLLWHAFVIALIQVIIDDTLDMEQKDAEILKAWDVIQSLQKAEEQSSYQVEKLLAAARK